MFHYEQEINVSFVIMSLSNVSVMFKCVFSMGEANIKHAPFG